MNWPQCKSFSTEVHGLHRLYSMQFDLIIVALLDRERARQAILIIEKFGIDKNKIVWQMPDRRRYKQNN